MLIKENDAELFLTDLCGRIYYRPKGVLSREGFDDEEIEVIGYDGHSIYFFRNGDCEQAPIDLVKLCLRPLSSMTIAEKIELCALSYAPDEMKTIEEKLNVIRTNADNAGDWFDANHFDYRGLIERGLAVEAPENMYNIKTD